jgi:hypothetical protein
MTVAMGPSCDEVVTPPSATALPRRRVRFGQELDDARRRGLPSVGQVDIWPKDYGHAVSLGAVCLYFGVCYVGRQICRTRAR